MSTEELDKIQKDDFIAMKMLTRHRELRKEMPKKPHPDLDWMLGLLEIVRMYDKKENYNV